MKWSPQQDNALVQVAKWIHDKDNDQQCFRLFGYAGTGKTTLAKHLAEGVDGTVLGAAYTGKASHVMRQKGFVGASTIHSLIYHSKDKSRALLKDLEAELSEVLYELNSELGQEDRGNPEVIEKYVDNDKTVVTLREKIEEERNSQSQPMFTLNTESVVKEADLVVVDEISMVDDRMGMDLLSFGTKVLVLGDPAQLPPIGGAGFFTENCTPDIMLDEIHRQAADNPIIAMATKIRNKEALAVGDYGDSMVAEKCHINETHALAADQILVGRNKTRSATNCRMRSLLGKSSNGRLPEAGDKLVCLHNNHDKGLMNGAIWMVDDIGQISENRVYMTILPEGGGYAQEVDAHAAIFRGEELHWTEKRDAEQFDYGYALTVHKSQGSQWDNVLLFDESHCFRKDKWRWLYTGLTRAAKRVILVRM